MSVDIKFLIFTEKSPKFDCKKRNLTLKTKIKDDERVVISKFSKSADKVKIKEAQCYKKSPNSKFPVLKECY